MDLERDTGIPREGTKAATHREEPVFMQMLLCFLLKKQKTKQEVGKMKNSKSERRAE